MKASETWKFIHSERAAMADTWAGLTPEQWAAPSWCEGWSVQLTAGHVLAAAQQTPLNFYKELIAAGFKFDVFTRQGAEKLAPLGPDELVRRLRARTTTTNHPPVPVMAMLGEIVVHGADIRRPLGLSHTSPEEALLALADSWKKSNLLIGAKRRISGLRLRATDAEWSSGEGLEVKWPPHLADHGHDRPEGSPRRPGRRRPPHPRRPTLTRSAAQSPAGRSPMTPRERSSPRRSALIPSSSRTSSLCWPSSGAAERSQLGAASSLKGRPCRRWRPVTG